MEDNLSLRLASARHASTFISNRLKIECREKKLLEKSIHGRKKDGKGSLTVEKSYITFKDIKTQHQTIPNFFSGTSAESSRADIDKTQEISMQIFY